MNTIEVNLTALEQAVLLAVGPQMREYIRALYFALDAAERQGYSAGRTETQVETSVVEDLAYNAGYDDGLMSGMEIGGDYTAKVNAQPEGFVFPDDEEDAVATAATLLDRTLH